MVQAPLVVAVGTHTFDKKVDQEYLIKSVKVTRRVICNFKLTTCGRHSTFTLGSRSLFIAFDFVHWYSLLIEAEQCMLFMVNKASTSLFLNEFCYTWWDIFAKTPFGQFLFPLLFTNSTIFVRTWIDPPPHSWGAYLAKKLCFVTINFRSSGNVMRGCCLLISSWWRFHSPRVIRRGVLGPIAISAGSPPSTTTGAWSRLSKLTIGAFVG